MFSHLISHSPTVTQKGYKVLIEDHPALSEGAAPPCGIHGQGRPFHRDVIEQSTPSKARLSSNPDVSNWNIKKTKLSLFRGHAVCYLSPQVLRDLTTLHSHSASAERILSSWLTVKWYPSRCGYSHRISYEVGKSLYQRCSPPCCTSGLISP